MTSLCNCSWAVTTRRDQSTEWEAVGQKLTKEGSCFLQQSFSLPLELCGFLLSGLVPGSYPLEGLGQEGYPQRGGLCGMQAPEACVLPVVVRVPKLPHCRGRGAASVSAHEPQGPLLFQTGPSQAAKEESPQSWQPAITRD